MSGGADLGLGHGPKNRSNHVSRIDNPEYNIFYLLAATFCPILFFHFLFTDVTSAVNESVS
jgi:hypothetical protein